MIPIGTFLVESSENDIVYLDSGATSQKPKIVLEEENVIENDELEGSYIEEDLEDSDELFDASDLLDDEEEFFDSDLAVDEIYNDEDLSEEDK